MIFLDLDGLYYVVSFFRKDDLHLIIRYDQDLPTWMSFFYKNAVYAVTFYKSFIEGLYFKDYDYF